MSPDGMMTGAKEDRETHQLVVAELRQEKAKLVPDGLIPGLRRQWARDEDAIWSLIADLHDYSPDAAVQKAIRREMTGSVGEERLLRYLGRGHPTRRRSSSEASG